MIAPTKINNRLNTFCKPEAVKRPIISLPTKQPVAARALTQNIGCTCLYACRRIKAIILSATTIHKLAAMALFNGIPTACANKGTVNIPPPAPKMAKNMPIIGASAITHKLTNQV